MMESQPLVSVIMPAYNAEKYIQKSIQSIIDQLYNNWELLVIDDGSTDNTQQIVIGFSGKDDRIKLFKNENNKGLVQARNKGLELSRGKYIANLDSDDIAKQNRLVEQVSFLENNPEYVLLGSACDIINTEGETTSIVTRDLPNDHIPTLLLFSNYFINSTSMMLASLAKEIKYAADTPLSEDYQLFVSLSKRGTIGNLRKSLVQYRVHETNISKEKAIDLRRATQNIQRKQLISMGVEFTDENLLIHNTLVEGTYKKFGFKLSHLEDWLINLVRVNEVNKTYPVPIFNYYAAFFYRRACQQSGLGIKAFLTLRKSELFNFIKKDVMGNSIFFTKSILKRF